MNQKIFIKNNSLKYPQIKIQINQLHQTIHYIHLKIIIIWENIQVRKKTEKGV